MHYYMQEQLYSISGKLDEIYYAVLGKEPEVPDYCFYTCIDDFMSYFEQYYGGYYDEYYGMTYDVLNEEPSSEYYENYGEYYGEYYGSDEGFGDDGYSVEEYYDYL